MGKAGGGKVKPLNVLGTFELTSFRTPVPHPAVSRSLLSYKTFIIDGIKMPAVKKKKI